MIKAIVEAEEAGKKLMNIFDILIFLFIPLRFVRGPIGLPGEAGVPGEEGAPGSVRNI